MDNKKVENKKHMSNKKKFWLGMSALAAVGVITGTVAWFQSSHRFNNPYQTKGYSVETQNIIDVDTANSMHSGQTVESDITIENTGKTPMLTRITYFDPTTEPPAGQTKKGENLSDYPTDDVPYQFNLFEDTKNKFLYNEDDGSYYYQGVLDETEEPNGVHKVQHLDSVTCTSVKKDGDELYKQDNGTWSADAARNGSKQTTVYGGKDIALSIIIETVQATDKDGKDLDKATVSKENVTNLKKHWDDMEIKNPLQQQ